MKVFLNESQIPELAGLDARQRQRLLGSALVVLKQTQRPSCWLPVILCCIGAVVGFVLSVLAVVLYLWHPMGPGHPWPERYAAERPLFGMAGAALGGMLGGFVGKQLLLRRLRPILRQMTE
jgi:hypothetical protein